MSGTSAISTTSRRELSSSPPPPLKSKAPKEIHAILTETLASFLPGQAKDLSAPLYRGAWGIASHIEQKCLVEYYWPTNQYSFLKFIYLFYLFFFFCGGEIRHGKRCQQLVLVPKTTRNWKFWVWKASPSIFILQQCLKHGTLCAGVSVFKKNDRILQLL